MDTKPSSSNASSAVETNPVSPASQEATAAPAANQGDSDANVIKTTTLKNRGNGEAVLNADVYSEQPVGSVDLTVYMTARNLTVDRYTLNDKELGDIDTYVQATRNLVGNGETTSAGFTAMAEYSRSDSSTKPSLGAQIGGLATTQHEFHGVKFTSTAFAGVESNGHNVHPYMEGTLVMDKTLLPDIKHTFNNGVSVGMMDNTLHAVAAATTHGTFLEAAISTTVLKAGENNKVEIDYAGFGHGHGTSLFGVDEEPPQSGLSINFKHGFGGHGRGK